ncbi:metallophosphoesterase [Roseibium sp.]|uniref:metallophosphoesterase n=1 Tax=Roseibium sp. TaxID=1936156 RepID=UPI003A976E1C
MIKIVVLSDLHIVPAGTLSHGLDTTERLETGIDFVNSRHADADLIVLAGDLADHGETAAYLRLQETIGRFLVPPVLTLGNHDNSDRFVAQFGAERVNQQTGRIDSVIDTNGHRVIVLDTSVPGQPGGRLQEAQLQWLKQSLEAAEGRPVIIIMHHNLTPFGVPTDSIILENGEAFAEIARSCGSLRHVIGGHVHMSVSGSMMGVPFCTIAGGHYNIEPRLGKPTPTHGTEVVPRREGPGQLAVVLSDEKATVVHMENYIDRHLVMAPGLFQK